MTEALPAPVAAGGQCRTSTRCAIRQGEQEAQAPLARLGSAAGKRNGLDIDGIRTVVGVTQWDVAFPGPCGMAEAMFLLKAPNVSARYRISPWDRRVSADVVEQAAHA